VVHDPEKARKAVRDGSHSKEEKPALRGEAEDCVCARTPPHEKVGEVSLRKEGGPDPNATVNR